MSIRVKDSFYLVCISIFALLFYILTIKGIYGNPPSTSIKNNLDQATKPFELSPERDRYILTQSLAQNGSFALSQPLADAAYPDDGYYNGRFYIFFAPGISLFALPFYYIGSHFNIAQIASYFMISIFAIGNLLVLFKISRDIFKLPVWSSLFVVLIFGFASTAWSYAVTLYQHQPTTFFIMSGFYSVWKYKQRKKFSFVWGMIVWLNYALAILIDYPNVVLFFPVIAYFFLSSWKIIKDKVEVTFSFRLAFLTTIIFFLIINGWHAYYNYTNFGSPLRVSGSLTGYKAIKEQKLFQKKSGQEKIKQIAAKKQPIHFFHEEIFTHGAQILLYSVDRGILFYSPIFILGLMGIFYSLRKISIEFAILTAIPAVNFFLYCSWGDPWGGYAFGPRYLIPSMAALSVFVGIWCAQVKHILLGKVIAFMLFVYSSAIALLGVLTTNAIPPRIEAVYLHTQYGYPLNYIYLLNGRSSSFLFNQFFSSYISLIGYYLVIFEILLVFVYVAVFITPMFKQYES